MRIQNENKLLLQQAENILDEHQKITAMELDKNRMQVIDLKGEILFKEEELNQQN